MKMHNGLEARIADGVTRHAPVTVREAVVHLLRSFGMTTIFGNPGSTEMPMFRDFPEDFRYVLGLQESIVVGMADGYAQATGNAAIVNLHSAAGVGHAMGNIFTAYKNCAPLVITVGQQARSMLPYDPFLHSMQATELPKPYVKWSCEPARARDVPAAIARAYYIAMQPPYGPTFVSIPVDDWDAEADYLVPRTISARMRADPVALQSLGAALESSVNPVFVAGPAIDRDGAWNEMVELAERHNALVWTSPTSGRCSFPETHPLFAGFLPPNREVIVERLAGHDLIVVLGAPAFSYHVEGSGPFIPPGAELFQINDDRDMAAWAPVGKSIVTSVGLVIADLLSCSANPKRSRPKGRMLPESVPAGTRISSAFLMQTLAEVRPADSIIVEEATSSRKAMRELLPIHRSATFFATSSGGLGYALPASVGVALAKSGQRVICLVGDGASMYAIQALWTAGYLNLPITFIVVNNGRYQALQSFAPMFGLKEAIGTDLPGLDFVAMARGHGIDGIRVEAPGELKLALADALRSSRAFLLEVVIE